MASARFRKASPGFLTASAGFLTASAFSRFAVIRCRASSHS